ncbi:MAG: DNA recombination protein RmuC [Candidatus Omnitrophota bacterium]
MLQVLVIVLLFIVLFVLAGIILILIRMNSAARIDPEKTIREEFSKYRDEASGQARSLREEVSQGQLKSSDVLVRASSVIEERFEKVRAVLKEQLQQMIDEQRKQMNDVVAALGTLKDAGREDQLKARETLEKKFEQIQQSNEKKLEEMRLTVDEKLHATLETRLNESFKIVSDRLEAVQRGLGEMKGLADGVGDLKRVLTNVKERGTWGEYQLGAILEQILTANQYAKNVKPKDGGEVVEFAVKLPGRDPGSDHPVWLPLDSKFPKEDYERLLQAVENADAEGVKSSTNALIGAVRKSARDIHDKYISPPHTTDFAIMFLPTEGLYAEILRQPGLQDELQSKYRVLAAGPTTLSAILSSLRIGFQTLAIEQRSHEVWAVLGGVKSEFIKFGDVLEKVRKNLNTATETIEKTQLRTRAMEKQLKGVQEISVDKADHILKLVNIEEKEDDHESKDMSDV